MTEFDPFASGPLDERVVTGERPYRRKRPFFPQPKPEPIARTKGRKDRVEAATEKAVRAEVEKRDGYCRLLLLDPERISWFGTCEGASEWAHLGPMKRFNTRGRKPEERHTTAGTAMLCTKHHADLDAHKFEIEAGSRGAQGRLTFVSLAGTYREGPRKR